MSEQANFRTACSLVLVNKYYCNLRTEQIRLLSTPSKLAEFAHQVSWSIYKQWSLGSPQPLAQNKTQIHGSNMSKGSKLIKANYKNNRKSTMSQNIATYFNQ